MAKVKGSGTSNSVLNYSAIDDRPYSGISYYRLKQTDYDGSFSYSNIKSVFIDEIKSSNVIVYPNPTSDEVTVILDKPEWDSIKVHSSNTGTDVTSLIHVFESNGQLKLDLESIKSGSYILTTKHSQTHLIVIK